MHEDRERKRLAGLLHDNLTQLLAVSRLKLERMAAQQNVERSMNTLIDVKRLLDQALMYSRTLTADLRPPLLGDEDDLKASLDWVAEKMSAHGLSVQIRDYGPPRVLNEDVLIVTYQAVQELLWNVVKHAGVREAFVSVEAMPECIQIAVHDYGKGFHASERPHPTNRGGFGLLNMRERLLSIGGRLETTSLPGHGTRAIIRVPMRRSSTPAAALKSGVETGHSAVPIRIVLVDDHEVVRKGLREALDEQPDMTVVGEAPTGPLALDLIGSTRPDVIIMDVHLLGDDGIEVTRTITRQWPSTRVIGFSIDDADRTVRALRLAGAADLISKAESLNTLLNAIRAIGNPFATASQ
jgi:CheY-like chemotaxis protein